MPRADIGDVSLHYEIDGDGEPVVFLNGVLMTVQSWVLQTSVVRRSHRCVMHDFRGQLLSDKPSAPWTLEDHVEDLRRLLDELGIARAHFVGTSYGGEVGLLFALRHCERVASLAVISCVSEIDEDLDRAVSLWAKTAIEAPETLYRVSLPFNFSPAFIHSNPDLLEQGEARLAACPPEFFQAFALLVDAFRQVDFTRELPNVECPTLVMVGELDRLKPPRFSRLIADQVPRSEFLVVPDAGHAVIIEKPEEVNTAILGFIEKNLSELRYRS